MMNLLRKIRDSILMWMFLYAGTKLFSVLTFHSSSDDEVGAVHFALNERELNVSMRTYVEELDKNGTTPL
jgi:hypothetical protein